MSQLLFWVTRTGDPVCMLDAGDPGAFDVEREYDGLASKLRSISQEISSEQRLHPRGAAHEVLGLRKPELLRVVSDWLATKSNASDAEVFQLCTLLWGGQTREEQMVATRLLARRRSALRQPSWSEIDAWRPAVVSIEGADAFAVHVLGPWSFYDVPVRIVHVRTMLDGGNSIERRMALVATVPLARDRASMDHAKIVLDFVDRAATDSESMVVDAVTWVLCALARHHRSVVEEFLAASTSLRPLSRQQVDNWLRTGSRRDQAVHDWRVPERTKPAPGSGAGGP